MKKVKITLGDLLKQQGMSINELSLQSDVRRAAISELVNGKRENINFRHIEQIAEALQITDIRKIITLVDEKE
ncbi:helix-turn-helix transcriptional regulator [Paenibacillus woosongensis]|uniref:Helix-turn-helix transcriptional regulator n=1 Tax=Paenibacillus woosongensis TaxID=307580 RepID=A0AA95IA81_9BACL|nr:helix-turn-helix transcriptional regulator [Paenibacillus woosongensis]WHX50209.1 helix-turn-helix transcriptional regulator [Paenibacillus woosongensis]